MVSNVCIIVKYLISIVNTYSFIFQENLIMRSFIWSLYKINDASDAYATCNICKKTIKRGTKEAGQKCFSMTPLHNHIKINHPKEYRKERNKIEQKRTAQFTPAVFSTGTTESEEIACQTSKQTSINEY